MELRDSPDCGYCYYPSSIITISVELYNLLGYCGDISDQICIWSPFQGPFESLFCDNDCLRQNDGTLSWYVYVCTSFIQMLGEAGSKQTLSY